MSLLWRTAVEAAKPPPSHDENLYAARLHDQNWGRQHHVMTPEEFGQQRGTFWHGSPNGEAGLKVAHYGIHVGSHKAATQALEARIGRPAEGVWDGTREYGKTLLRRHGYGYGVEHGQEEHYYPSGKASYSDGTAVSLDAKPHVFPVRIIGEMTNSTGTPHEDFKANGLMAGQIKRGTARRGYYYTNVGEDEGSISAVVPARSHLATHEDYVRHALAHPMQGADPVPSHIREWYGL